MKTNTENKTIELTSEEFWSVFDKMLWDGMNFVLFFTFAHHSFSKVETTGFELVFKRIAGNDIGQEKVFLTRGAPLKKVVFTPDTNGFDLVLENDDEATLEFMKRFNATPFLPDEP